MIPVFPQTCEVRAQFTKIFLEIALHVQKFTQLQFSKPHPIGKGISGNFTKNYFDGKCMKCLDVHTKLHFIQPFTPHWSSGEVGCARAQSWVAHLASM